MSLKTITEVGPGLAPAGALPTSAEASPSSDGKPMTATMQSSRILNSWRPSERRRLGLLSARSYDRSGLSCPTDVWSYQQLFIEQRRDDRNPWAARPLAR